MANTVEYIYQIQDQFSRNLRRFQDMTEKATSKVDRLRTKMRQYSQSLHDAGGKMAGFGAGMTASVTAPITAAGVMSLKASAQVETLTTNFESLLGSSEKAADMMQRLKDFSAGTPFQLEGIASTSRMLLGFGVAQEDIISRLKMLGDVASGTGRGLGEIGLIFGQIKAKGKLQGEELLQLAERGIPILKTLAEMYGTSTAKVQKFITAGRVGFDDVTKAFEIMTSKGGLFADQMAKQSTTLAGLFSTFKDVMFLAQAEFGTLIDDLFDVKGTLKGITDGLKSMASRVRAFAQENPKLTKLAFSIAGIAAVAGPALAALGLITMGIAGLGSAIGIMLSPVTITIAAFAALAAGFAYVYTQSAPLQEFMAGLWGNIKDLGSAFGELFVALGGGQDAFSDMSGVIEYLGMSFEVALTPLKIMIQLITTAVGLITDLINLDLGSALSRISGATTDIGGTIGGAFNRVSDFFNGETQAENVAVRKTINASNSVTVGGEVRVKAEPGTKVTQTNIGLNGGNNVAMAY